MTRKKKSMFGRKNVMPVSVGAPSFVSGSSAEHVGAAVDIPYTGVAKNNILFIQCIVWGTANWAVPTGWTQILEGSLGGAARLLLWKRSDGTETGNQLVTWTGNTGYAFGAMSSFFGAKEDGTPFRNEVDNPMTNETAVTIDPNTITTDIDCLAIAFFWFGDSFVIVQDGDLWKNTFLPVVDSMMVNILTVPIVVGGSDLGVVGWHYRDGGVSYLSAHSLQLIGKL